MAIPLAAAAIIAIALATAWSPGLFADDSAAAPATSPAVTESAPKPVTPAPQSGSAGAVTIETLSQMKYSPVWNPADTGDGFWQVVDPEMGYPETGGTRYILAHACESKACAGDDLLGLTEGDTFDFLGTPYVIDQKFSAQKNAIADQPIWEHVPGRVVLITCIIDGSWEDSDHNEVFIAAPAA